MISCRFPSKKPRRASAALHRAAAALLALFCALSFGCAKTNPPAQPGLAARVDGKTFLVRNRNGEYEHVFLNGVNIGATKAGYFPGEFGVTEDDYYRWMQSISDMNVSVIRVYVNLMPAFYNALYRFNKNSDKPLYLMHGVYVNEDLLAQYPDVFDGDGAVIQSFQADVENAIDMIHGNAEVEKLPGNASGSYTSDVSRWVIGWILGVEFSADVVLCTNAGHAENDSFDGDYVHTENASPFEVFLAEIAECAISYEETRYQAQRPVAFCNWCTTDPLSHPNEPTPETEDAVSVDAEHILACDAFEAGFFASYHVYPYYPDFLSYDKRYQTEDPYLAYLQELNAYHSMPVLIAEYGIPSSRGIAHENMISGLSQGHASEVQQAEWIISMNRDIREAGCMGGLIFAWQDEWFKRTWNSADYESADRRPFWQNVQSPEACFGLLAIEPGEKKTVVTLDGLANEWKRSRPLIENDGVSVYAQSDAAYLYLLIRAEDYDFAADTLYLPLDVLPEQGNTHYETLSFASGADFLLRINGIANSAMLVDAYYDVFQFDYSVRTQLVDPVPGQSSKDSGVYNPIRLAMDRGYLLPETGERTTFQSFDTGALRYGNGDPSAEAYDSLADFCASGNVVEVRIPWILLNVMDPSTKLAMDDFHAVGEIRPVSIDGIRIGVCRNDTGAVVSTALYAWDDWEIPQTHERLKQSYHILRDYFASGE